MDKRENSSSMLLRQLMFPMEYPPPRIRLEYEDIETAVFGGKPMITRERVNWQATATAPPPIFSNPAGNNQNPISALKQLNPFEMLIILFKSVLCWYIIYTANLTDGGLGGGIGTGIAHYRLYDPAGNGETTGVELWPRDQGGFLHHAYGDYVAAVGNWAPHGSRIYSKDFNGIRLFYVDCTGAVVTNAFDSLIQVTASIAPTNTAADAGYIVLWGFNNGSLQPFSARDIVAGQLLYTFDLSIMGSLSGYWALQIIAPDSTLTDNQLLTWTVNFYSACDSFAHKPQADIVTNGAQFDQLRVTAASCQLKTIAAPEADEGTMVFVPLPPQSTEWSNFIVGIGPTNYLTDYLMDWKNNFLKAILDEDGAGGYMVPKPAGIDEFKMAQPFKVSNSVDIALSPPFIEDYIDPIDPNYEVVMCCINTQNILYGSSTGGSAADFICSFGEDEEVTTPSRILESLKMPENSDDIFKEAIKMGMRAKQFGSNNFEIWDILENVPAITGAIAGTVLSAGNPAGGLAGWYAGKQFQNIAKSTFEGEGKKRKPGPKKGSKHVKKR